MHLYTMGGSSPLQYNYVHIYFLGDLFLCFVLGFTFQSTFFCHVRMFSWVEGEASCCRTQHCTLVRFEPTTLRFRDPHSNQLSKLMILPISWVSRDMCLRMGRGQMSSLCFIGGGQMSTIMHLLRGQMSSSVKHLGGRCPHMPFFTGGQMSKGANVRLPSFASN